MSTKELFAQIVTKDLNFEELIEKVNGWPTCVIDDEHEDLDTENFEVLNITDHQIDICCGGDWQEPKSFSIVKHEILDELMVINITDGFSCGLTNEQILKELNF